MLNNNNLPFVSIATVTFNRRPFIPYLIKCIEHQTYPIDKIEWVIIDDGTDKIENLVIHLPYVKYFQFHNKIKLSKKRNILNEKCTGDIIVYFDDDDYYPPERVNHAVETLLNNPEYLIAGSSLMHIYYKDIKTMYSFGPYRTNHSTAATFAFRKELLEQTKYAEDDCLSEEKIFLKNYAIPLIQMDSRKCILVFRHIHNSFDKNELIKSGANTCGQISNLNVDDFIKDPELKEFYTKNLDNILSSYHYGEPINKPDVIIYYKETTEKRNNERKEIEKKISEYENAINKAKNRICLSTTQEKYIQNNK
jgi:glycosyltransferase involved in cell wall biosynthesis